MIEKHALRQRAAGALLWSALRSALLSVASPLLTLALTRWLAPADFGLVGVATLVFTFGSLLQTAGLTPALIRLPEAEARRAAPAVFWINLALSSALYGLLWLSAPLMARWYGAPELIWVLRVSGWRLPLAAATAVPLALAQREFGFRAVAGAQLAATLTPLLVAVPLAALGWGYGALVWGLLAGTAANALVLWVQAHWRPQPVDWRATRSLLRFGGLVTLENLELWALAQADNVIVSLALGLGALGLYNTGFNLAFFAVSAFSEPVLPVAYSAFSRLQNDVATVREAYLKLTRLLVAAAWPLGVGLALVARPAVTVFLGEAWHPIIPVLEVFALYAGFAHLWSLNPEVFKALNQPGRMPRVYGGVLLYVLPICLLTAPLGLTLFTLARGSAVFIALTLHWRAARQTLGVMWRDWWRMVRAPLVGCAGMAIGVLALRAITSPSALQLLGLILTGVALYIASLWLLDRTLPREVWGLLQEMRATKR